MDSSLLISQSTHPHVGSLPFAYMVRLDRVGREMEPDSPVPLVFSGTRIKFEDKPGGRKTELCFLWDANGYLYVQTVQTVQTDLRVLSPDWATEIPLNAAIIIKYAMAPLENVSATSSNVVTHFVPNGALLALHIPAPNKDGQIDYLPTLFMIHYQWIDAKFSHVPGKAAFLRPLTQADRAAAQQQFGTPTWRRLMDLLMCRARVDEVKLNMGPNGWQLPLHLCSVSWIATALFVRARVSSAHHTYSMGTMDRSCLHSFGRRISLLAWTILRHRIS